MLTNHDIILLFSSAAEPPLFWAAPAPNGQGPEPTPAPTYLGRLRLQEEIAWIGIQIFGWIRIQ